MLEENKIYLADAIELAKEIPSGSVDHILLDPPYYLGKKKFENKKKQYKRVSEEWDNQWESIEEYLDWCDQWLAECKRILKDGGTISIFGTFHNAFHLNVLMREHLDFKNFITWFKPNAMPIMMAKKMGVYAWSCEYINYFSKGPVEYFNYELLKDLNNGAQQRDFLNVFDYEDINTIWEKIYYYLKQAVIHPFIDLIIHNNRPHSESIGHPTQKPEKLVNYLLQAHTKEGDLVVDLFSGSGTVACECKKLNRKFISVEREETFYNKSVERLEKTII